jgi:anti-anti-sigma factor
MATSTEGIDSLAPVARVFRAGRTGFVALQGALRGAGADALAETFGGARLPCRVLVLDLRGVPYADSDGIRALLRLQADLAERQIRLSVVVPDASPLRRALHLLGFDRLLDLHQTARQAWRAPSSAARRPSSPPRPSRRLGGSRAPGRAACAA